MTTRFRHFLRSEGQFCLDDLKHLLGYLEGLRMYNTNYPNPPSLHKLHLETTLLLKELNRTSEAIPEVMVKPIAEAPKKETPRKALDIHNETTSGRFINYIARTRMPQCLVSKYSGISIAEIRNLMQGKVNTFENIPSLSKALMFLKEHKSLNYEDKLKVVSNEIRKRLASKIALKTIAYDCGVLPRQLQKFLNSEYKPSYKILEKVYKYLPSHDCFHQHGFKLEGGIPNENT